MKIVLEKCIWKCIAQHSFSWAGCSQIIVPLYIILFSSGSLHSQKNQIK